MDPIYEEYENIDEMPTVDEIFAGGFAPQKNMTKAELTNQPHHLEITLGNIHNFKYILEHRATWHFLFVGKSHCPYCQQFNPTYEKLINDKSILDVGVRFMRAMISDEDISTLGTQVKSILGSMGVHYDTVPALFLVIPGSPAPRFIHYRCEKRDYENIKNFIMSTGPDCARKI